MITTSDITFLYSGGLFNETPDSSLGGLPSSISVTNDQLNNLFDDITDTSVTSTEYRAIYVLNTSSTETMYNVKVWAEDGQEEGASTLLGVPLDDEVQTITFANYASISGTFTIKHGANTTDTITWTSDSTDMAQNIQSALRDTDNLSDVLCSFASDSGGSRTFQITFTGADGNKLQSTLQITNKQLFPSSLSDVTITVSQQGSPINDIASDIIFENNAPSGIVFTSTSRRLPVVIGHLEPKESFFVWLRRIVSAGTVVDDFAEDSFTLKVRGQTLPSPL